MGNKPIKYTRNRRRQQVCRQLIIGGAIALGIIVSIASYIERRAEKSKAQEASHIVEHKTGEKKKEKKETAGEKLARVRKEAEEAGYPDEVIQLLSKNPETVDFVEGYGKKKGTPAAPTIGEVEKGSIPHLLQWDERWGYAPYGTSTVAVSGCGPTCLAMVLAGLTGDASITPAVVAAYGTENDYIDEENNTYWSFMEEAPRNWNIACREIGADENEVGAELSLGHPIICSVGPGDFTKNGHFIVLVGYQNGEVTVYDPFSRENSDRTWVYADIVSQFKAMWVYSS